MICDGKKQSNDRRPVTGKYSYRHSVQHGIVSLSLLLLLASLAIPSVGAQPPPGTGSDLPYTRFTPSMAVIIAVLVAALFFMGFFSVYIRQCSDSSAIGSVRQLGASIRTRRAATAAAARGLDVSVIETFPTFVYSEVKGQKIGKGALECAVCLCEFEDDESLRLIPKCDHVFHPECIDEWLSSHVTCPVCRADLVPQPDETIQVPDPNAVPVNIAIERENGDVSIRISDDDHVVNIPDDERSHVVDRNQSLNRNRPLPPRSWSVRSSLFGSKFPRSHSTGHSLIQPGENTDRFTLRLPEDVRKQVMKKCLKRTASCVVVLPREGSSRRGYRAGRPEQLDRSVKSDRWGFSMFTRASSLRSPKVVDGEGTSSTTPKGGSQKAVRMPSFKCLEPKCDETGLLPADAVKSQV